MSHDQTPLDLVIVGAGGFARELHAWLPDVFSPAEFRFKGFLGRTSDRSPARLLADPCDYAPKPCDRFLLAIGDLAARRKVTSAIEEKSGQFINFIHPTCVIAPTAKIGRGAVIYPQAIVSNAAVLGDFVHLSLYASVGHDAVTGDNCYLAPYATLNGESRIGDDVLLGSHATVATRISVGNRVSVSANSSVMRDAPGDSIVFGVPGVAAPRLQDSTTK